MALSRVGTEPRDPRDSKDKKEAKANDCDFWDFERFDIERKSPGEEGIAEKDKSSLRWDWMPEKILRSIRRPFEIRFDAEEDFEMIFNAEEEIVSRNRR